MSSDSLNKVWKLSANERERERILLRARIRTSVRSYMEVIGKLHFKVETLPSHITLE